MLRIFLAFIMATFWAHAAEEAAPTRHPGYQLTTEGFTLKSISEEDKTAATAFLIEHNKAQSYLPPKEKCIIGGENEKEVEGWVSNQLLRRTKGNAWHAGVITSADGIIQAVIGYGRMPTETYKDPENLAHIILRREMMTRGYIDENGAPINQKGLAHFVWAVNPALEKDQRTTIFTLAVNVARQHASTSSPLPLSGLKPHALFLLTHPTNPDLSILREMGFTLDAQREWFAFYNKPQTAATLEFDSAS